MNESPFETPLDTRIPNFESQTANLHYQSEETGEVGCIRIRKPVTEETILAQYQQQFPRECEAYISTIRDINTVLRNPTGMSQEKVFMSLTKVPEVLYVAMKYIDVDYWTNKRNVYRFIRKYPRFSIGEHSVKEAGKYLIKEEKTFRVVDKRGR